MGLVLFSCQEKELLSVDYQISTAKNISENCQSISCLKFLDNDQLDLGFYEGDAWIQLKISNRNLPQSIYVVCGDLINRNYIFYKYDTTSKVLVEQREVDLAYRDHRTTNFPKPNFKIELESNEESIYFIKTSSDGRILQASPELISQERFISLEYKTYLFDAIFYGIILILLVVNLWYYKLVKSKIYYYYAFYIVTSCLMYLFVEGRLYGLGLSHFMIDHLMFMAIRCWILSSVLFIRSFLSLKSTLPVLHRVMLVLLFVTLVPTTAYQLLFPATSISNLHQTENVIGFIWIVFTVIVIIKSFKKRRLESVYYFISYTIFLFFVTMGLLDSHFTILPGDPFLYFKIGTIFEFIGFTYFISLLVKKQLTVTKRIEEELLTTKEKLTQKTNLLAHKKGVEKTDLVSISKLMENKLSSDQEWGRFLKEFKALSPKFLEDLLNKYPQLSKSDTRLLILLKVGYSQKEIADLLSIAPDSVKKARTRLRKKIRIKSSENLNTFLDSY